MRTLFFSLAFALLNSCASPSATSAALVSSKLESYVCARLEESPLPEREPELEELAAAVAEEEGAQVLFICTHNSRRSHLCQVWAQTGADRFGLEGVRTYSGETEATAFNERAAAALERAGFEVERGEGWENPVYRVRAGAGGRVMECSSKVFDAAPNPTSGFIAVMTCSSADRACPYVAGADQRIALPYEDPRLSDGTPEETATYDERCAEIACDILWVMRRAAELRRGS